MLVLLRTFSVLVVNRIIIIFSCLCKGSISSIEIFLFCQSNFRVEGKKQKKKGRDINVRTHGL